MSWRFGTWRALATVLGVVGGASCGDETLIPPPAPSPAPASNTDRPLDQLAPGELPEGRTAAFGLTLPASMRVETATPRFIRARGFAAFEAVADFVRQRV